MKFISRKSDSESRVDRSLLINALTLIALGFSILFLNSWDNLVVRTSVGLFWGAFFLILNGPEALRTFRQLKQKNDTQRRGSYTAST
ncbi:MAG TPA: hypothetical protein VKD91_20075 [Pyrinomonadaceae bacterium]|nr:hypothetical protein [Pyrinomonadaceae bacterium]